ncbi:MAG TPA: DUF368 domain-containing protein [Flavobacteriaceae bacterium]|jgi:putative membrane protein|nr:DUF368 domain-containing protein [Flavobacteriaceae bacterium]
MKKGMLSNIIVFLKGMAMGIADIIPGVSGGTIAIITGIYEEFLSTLNNINLKIIKLLFKGKFKFLWEKYNLSFLSSLILGILTSVILLSYSITYLIVNYPIILWSFFLGLIASSIIYLFKEIKIWNRKTYLFLYIGLFFSLVMLTIYPSKQEEVSFIYLFFCGMISITAMLLPGVSGAYILVLLGAYETILNTLKEVIKFNSDYFLNFFSFIVGAILSIKLFSKLLTWAYKKHKNHTLSCLVGFMIGSLPNLWPWKSELNSEELLFSKLYIPVGYFMNADFRKGILFILIGILMIFILEYLTKKSKNV